MYRIEDNFYDTATFNRILELVRERPINQVPENYVILGTRKPIYPNPAHPRGIPTWRNGGIKFQKTI